MLAFKGEGLIDAMRTDGRTTINMSVAEQCPRLGEQAIDRRMP